MKNCYGMILHILSDTTSRIIYLMTIKRANVLVAWFNSATDNIIIPELDFDVQFEADSNNCNQ